MQIPYCTFKETGSSFRNKKIYRCSYCGTQLCLDDPEINIICFKKHEEIVSGAFKTTDVNNPEILNIHTTSPEHFQNELVAHLEKQKQNSDSQENNNQQPTIVMQENSGLCSKEQIEHRLAICNTCEHFKDNSCLLCGCVIVREKNFNNKLAHKNHSCPINKWGPIVD